MYNEKKIFRRNLACKVPPPPTPLSDLYALRAGLSVISEQKDHVNKIKDQTDHNFNKLRETVLLDIAPYYLWKEDHHHLWEEPLLNTDKDFTFNPYWRNRKKHGIEESAKQRVSEKPELYEKLLKNGTLLNDLEEEKENTIKDLKRLSKELNSQCFKFCVGLTLIIIGILAIVITSLLYHYETIKRSAFVISIITSAIDIIVVSFLTPHIKTIKSTKCVIQEKQNYLQEDQYNTVKNYYNRLEKCLVVKQEANDKMKPYIEQSDLLYEVLVRTYACILDPRDWQYLDLIIFYFETGRAENMKEALQQLDRERQTKEIVGAINQATSLICRTITSEMSALRRTVESGFATLSNNICSLQNSIEAGFAQSNAIRIAQLNEAKLGNALRAKSAETSEQLLSDVHYMKSKLYY